jgi:hypothetical protein
MRTFGEHAPMRRDFLWTTRPICIRAVRNFFLTVGTVPMNVAT